MRSLKNCHFARFIFLIIMSGFSISASSQSCFDCHSKNFENRFSHFPAKEGQCDICHDVKTEHLINQDPKAVITDNTSVACYNCHDTKESDPQVHGALRIENQC